jgi:DNA repair photolyase
MRRVTGKKKGMGGNRFRCRRSSKRHSSGTLRLYNESERDPMLKVAEVRAKSILNKSKIFDYCVNPYTGCEHNCAYCYARLFICRYSGHTEPWGRFVDAKVNAPELLRKQLVRAKRARVWIASVCDPYQPLEEKYRLTRHCLEELAARQFPVVIQTKSALILRDLDLFQRFEEIEIGFSIATESEEMARLFEPRASPVRERLKALEIIHEKGIKTFVFAGPLLPGSAEVLAGTLEGKADHVLIDRMNYIPTLKNFYLRHRLERESTDAFFHRQKTALVDALKKRGMSFEALF